MKSPTCRAKQLAQAFMKYFDEEFEEKWASPSHPLETEPDPESLSAFQHAVKERDIFLEFHKENSTLTSAGSPCQCTLVEQGNHHIISNNIPHTSHTYDCDCGNPITPLVPLKTNDASMTYDVCNDLIEGYFNYLFTSMCSIPSIDQPGHGGCVYTGIAKWTYNEKVRGTINEVYAELGFPPLIHLSDTHARIIISLFSHCFITGEISCEVFNLVLDSLDGFEDKIIYDGTILSETELEPFIEWLFIGASKHIAGDDEPVLAKLRRNIQALSPKRVGGIGNAKVEILAAAAFFEIVFPVKYAIFTVNEGLHKLMSSDIHLFHPLYAEQEGTMMKPVTLVMLVVSESHLDKTIVSPGFGAYVKGEHILPQWVKESTKGIDVEPGSVAELIKNWDDGNNDIFPTGTNSEEARKFKQSRRGKWILRLPRFKNLDISDADENLAMSHLKFSPMGILLGIILDTFSSDLGSQMANWIHEHRLKTHLFGCALWDQRWSNIVPFELHFICTNRAEFFNETADMMTIHDLTAKMSDWAYSSLIEIPAPTPRPPQLTPREHATPRTRKVPRMQAEIRDHNSAPSSATMQPLGRGCKRHRSRARAYTFGANNIFAEKPMSCVVAAIVALVLWIAGVDVLDQVNDRFPPTNNVGVSFAMISSVEIVHELIDWKFLPVESTKRGSITWKYKLFRELATGFYWAQLDLRDGVQFVADHVIAVHIIKDWKLCNGPEEYIGCMLDNRGRTDFAQLKDIDVDQGADVGETILNLFLGIPNSRITSIIRLKPRTAKNSSYVQAANTAARFKDRRVTRQWTLQNSTQSTSATSSQASNRRKRRNQRTKSRKSTSKTVEKVKRLYKCELPPHLRPRKPVHAVPPVRSSTTSSAGCKNTF